MRREGRLNGFVGRFEQRGEKALGGLIEAGVRGPLVGAEGDVDALERRDEWRMLNGKCGMRKNRRGLD